MANFKLGEEMRNEVINMSRSRDIEKIRVPDRNWTYDLPYIVRMLQPLSYEGFVTSCAIFKVHVSDHPTGVRKVTVSISVGDSDFFFVPRYARDMLIA